MMTPRPACVLFALRALRVLLIVSTLVLLAAASGPPRAVAAADLAALQKRLEPHYKLQRPEGTGPFPAILMVSGCSGFTPSDGPTFFTRQAERLKSEGSVVIFVDYLAARGFATCRDRGGSRGLAPEIGPDVLAAAAYLRAQPFVKADDVVAIGWSMGGGGVLAALESIPSSETFPLRAVVAFYPACADVRPWKARVPALMLLGGLDDIAPADDCQKLAKKVAGAPIEVRLYRDARHAFDVSEFPPMLKRGPGTVGYHETAARTAWDDVRKFLGR